MTDSIIQVEPQRALIYLDQNVYSEMRTNIELIENLKKNFIVMYSDNTLDEFEGRPELTDKYISILNEFENRFVENRLDDEFRITD